MRCPLFFLLLCAASPAWALCEGRYDTPAALISDTYDVYGTLWSGGFSKRDAGETLEVYRLLSGLPAAGLADAPDFRGPALPYRDPYIEEGSLALRFGVPFSRALDRVVDPDYRRVADGQQTDPHVWLNVHLGTAPYPGWWLTPDAPQLTEKESLIARLAEGTPALRWLLMVQAASAAPWQDGDRWLRDAELRTYTTLYSSALAEHEATATLAAFVAAELLRHAGRAYGPLAVDLGHEGLVESTFKDLQSRVTACTATEAEYAAYALARFERARPTSYRDAGVPVEELSILPTTLRRMLAVIHAKENLRGYWWRERPTAEVLQTLSGDPRFQAWYNVGLSYRATSLEELITINDGTPLDPKVLRMVNVLSVDDLFTFADARADYPAEHRALYTAAFLRLFVLRRDAEAEARVPELLALWPDAGLGAIWEGRGSTAYRLAKVAAALPDARTLITPEANPWDHAGDGALPLQGDWALHSWSAWRRGMDLPLNIRTGGFLERDADYWMRYTGVPGWHAAHRRAIRRGLHAPHADITILPRDGSSYGPAADGLANWAAWSELHQLGPERGLAHRIGQEVIAYERANPPTLIRRYFIDEDQRAADLAAVIQRGRRMIQGEVDGRPLGQVAFTLLHERYSGTEAAQATPYWYICRERCEP